MGIPACAGMTKYRNGRGGGGRTRDLLLPKQARFHCATPRNSNTMILCFREPKND